MGERRDIPVRLTRAQVREVDRRSIEQFHIPGVVLMENAARAVTEVALEMLRGVENPTAVIVCGGGNNGGDGLAVARHLHNRGVSVRIVLAVDPNTYRGDAQINWRIIQAMRLPLIPAHASLPQATADAHLLIDALFGTGLASPPRDTRPIEWINQTGLPILSIDLPSGLDCDTGELLGPHCVGATRTVTFVAEKAGFGNPSSRQYLGHVTVGDIGCPRELIEAIAGASPT